MKNPITKEEISRFRQQMSLLTEKLRALALKAGYADRLFGGVPCEVYRSCGKATCRCMSGGERHGPYKVVQVWHNKRSRQVTLKKDEQHFFKMAEHYQYQMHNREEIVEVQKNILDAVDTMLERRIIWKKE